VTRVTLLCISLILVFFLVGCMTETRVYTAQIAEFTKNIKADHPNVKNFKVHYTTPGFSINYTLKKPISQNEAMELFYKTKDLYFSDRFQKEVVEDIYYKKYTMYTDNGRFPPHIYIGIVFPGNGDEKRTVHSFSADGCRANEDGLECNTQYPIWGYDYLVDGKFVKHCSIEENSIECKDIE